MAKVVVIGGAGKVGGELKRQLVDAGHQIIGEARRSLVVCEGKGTPIHGVGETDEIIRALEPVIPKADAVMLCIPNTRKGDDELQYMEAFRSKAIVTSAKAGHAYQFERVLKLGQPVGRRATVGGGTDMLEILRRRHLSQEKLIIHAVLNGTDNDIWSTIQRGGSFARAVGQARALGYAEPDNGGKLIDVPNGELLDKAMKSAIIYNVALRSTGNFLSADDFKIVKLETDDIRRLTSRNARYRYIVTFASVPNVDEIAPDSPGSIVAQCGRWRITGGFQNVLAETPWYDWLRQVDDVNNGYTIHNEFAQDTGDAHSGPGAGPEVTAKAMMRDLHDLLAA